MRISPVINTNQYTNNYQTRTQQGTLSSYACNVPHKYTGNVSADLAYASLVDENIANDLKSMGLIA